jgi:trk system potassium uptake protein TrkH
VFLRVFSALAGTTPSAESRLSRLPKGNKMFGRNGLHPSQLISIAFTAIILSGTLLLSLPISSVTGQSTRFFDALFTATSATTVTGLNTVDTETHWSLFGHVVIALLIQIGGFGIVGFASLVAILLDGRVSLRTRLNATSETGSSAPDVKSLLMNVLKIMLFFQLILAIILTWRFATEYQYDFNEAMAHGVFHAISAFNNAGFALYSDSMMQFARDGWIIIPVFTTVMLASLGFPTIGEIRDRLVLRIARIFKLTPSYSMPKQWSLNSRIVLWASLVLVVLGSIAIAILEWSNPNTLGPLTPFQKIMDSIFAAVMPRTAGFNALDVSQMEPTSWLVTSLLMFIGGASASTAGGIKLGTFVVLIYIVYTEIRGDTAVNIGNRRLPRSMQRQALTIVSLYAIVTIGALLILRMSTEFSLDQILFEVVSAVGTVGLSTGITAELPEHAKFLLSLLMLFGRLGPIIVATSLALRKTKRHFEYPKERPLIG